MVVPGDVLHRLHTMTSVSNIFSELFWNFASSRDLSLGLEASRYPFLQVSVSVLEPQGLGLGLDLGSLSLGLGLCLRTSGSWSWS